MRDLNEEHKNQETTEITHMMITTPKREFALVLVMSQSSARGEREIITIFIKTIYMDMCVLLLYVWCQERGWDLIHCSINIQREGHQTYHTIPQLSGHHHHSIIQQDTIDTVMDDWAPELKEREGEREKKKSKNDGEKEREKERDREIER